MILSVRRRNQLVADLGRRTFAPGAGVRAVQTNGGTILSAETGVVYQHPWFTSARWDAAQGAWCVQVNPGLVNGIDPTFQDVPLLDLPEIPVQSFRPVGGERGDTSEAVPAFFRAQGVATAQAQVAATTQGDLINRTGEARPDNERQLRAVDIVLAIARPAVVSVVVITDASGTSGSQVLYGYGLDTRRVDQVGTRPVLRAEYKYTPPTKPTLMDRLIGAYQEPQEDTLLISTLYLLSGPGATADDQPDNLWQPYARHSVFWNLCHASRNEAPDQPSEAITLFTGLGIGDSLFNTLLSTINDWSARVQNALDTSTQEGRFFT